MILTFNFNLNTGDSSGLPTVQSNFLQWFADKDIIDFCIIADPSKPLDRKIWSDGKHLHVAWIIPDYFDAFHPVHTAAAVDIYVNVRSPSRLFKVVAADVAGSDGLYERPPRSAEVGGGVNLQFAQLFHAQRCEQRIDEFPDERFGVGCLQRMLEMRVEDEYLMQEPKMGSGIHCQK